MASAAELLRTARVRAKLSQRELAERVGVAQSVISVYEAGRRQPSLQTLERLIEATGQRLRLNIEPQDVPVPPLLPFLHQHRTEIQALAAEYQVVVLGVFGSVARGEETEGSDVDLLVDIGSDVGLFALGRLRARLADLIGADVDLVPQSTLKAGVRPAVTTDLIPL